MNSEQVKSLLRGIIATFGGIIAGFFAAKGWFSVDQVTSVLNSPMFLGLATSGVMYIWGLLAHTDKNAVAVVTAMADNPASPVQGVIVAPSPAGRDLAAAIPGAAIAPAGTTQAANLAGA